MHNGTNELAEATAGAFVRINRQKFLHYSLLCFYLKQMGRFFVQTQTCQGFCRRDAVFIPAVMSIEFIHHSVELVPIDLGADNIRRSPAAGFIKITVIQHVALDQVVAGKTLSQVEKSLEV